MTSSIPMRAVVSLLAALALLPLGRAAAQPSPEASPGTAAAEARKEAARLFAEGRALHQAGDYASAIAKFRRANDLAPDPLVLFAIAQAQRLAGDCAARDTYASFLAAAPATSLRASVEKHIAQLSTRCPASPAPVVAAPSAPEIAAAPPAPTIAAAATEPAAGPARPLEPVALSLRERHGASALPPAPAVEPLQAGPAPSSRGRRALVVGSFASGGALLGAAISVAIWNEGRHRRWGTEDRALDRGPAGLGITDENWVALQQMNDERLRSIRRADVATWALASGGAGCLIVGSILALTARATPSVAALPTRGGLVVAAGGMWP